MSCSPNPFVITTDYVDHLPNFHLHYLWILAKKTLSNNFPIHFVSSIALYCTFCRYISSYLKFIFIDLFLHYFSTRDCRSLCLFMFCRVSCSALWFHLLNKPHQRKWEMWEIDRCLGTNQFADPSPVALAEWARRQKTLVHIHLVLWLEKQ